MKSFYRICNPETQQGLWYDFQGEFTGLIHADYNFCGASGLRMDFDPLLVGWLSATSTLEDFFQWFSKEDVLRLQEHGYYIHRYEAVDYQFYERFQHLVIKQSTSRIAERIVLEEELELAA